MAARIEGVDAMVPSQCSQQPSKLRPSDALALPPRHHRSPPHPRRPVSRLYSLPQPPDPKFPRQREADRAPPLVVLSLPERIWTPDIVWEKDDSDSDKDTPTPVEGGDAVPSLPPISPSDVRTPPAIEVPMPDPSGSQRRKDRAKSGSTVKKYFSKDECAICMDSFQRGEVVRILPCGHVFHKDECDEWLLKWRKLVSGRVWGKVFQD